MSYRVISSDREEPETGFDEPTLTGACDYAIITSAAGSEPGEKPIVTCVVEAGEPGGDGWCSKARYVGGRQVFPHRPAE